jgi:ankyrin repeat protein
MAYRMRRAITTATVEGDAEAVATMLDVDDRLFSTVWEGNPLLTISAMIGHVNLVNLLLERGVAVDATSYYGNTALLVAAGAGHAEVVSILLRSGADIARTGFNGSTVLTRACAGGNLAVVRMLLQRMGGRGLNTRNNFGCTALWYACNDWRPVLVKTLLLAGADHTIATNSGCTVRDLANVVEHGDAPPLIKVS